MVLKLAAAAFVVLLASFVSIAVSMGHYCVPKTNIFDTSRFDSESERFMRFKLWQKSSHIL